MENTAIEIELYQGEIIEPEECRDIVAQIHGLRSDQKELKAAHPYQPLTAEYALLSTVIFRHDWRHIFEGLPTDDEQIQYCADVFFNYVSSFVQGQDSVCDSEAHDWVFRILSSWLKKSSSSNPQIVQKPASREESDALSESSEAETQVILTPTTTTEAEISSIEQQIICQKHIRKPQLPRRLSIRDPKRSFKISVSGATFAATDATTITIEDLMTIYYDSNYGQCWTPPLFADLKLEAFKAYVDDLGIHLSPQWEIWVMFPDGSSKPVNNDRVLLEVVRICWRKKLAFVSVFIGPSQ